MTDTVTRLMDMIERYADVRANTNDWTDAFIAKAKIQEELNRLFTPLSVDQIESANIRPKCETPDRCIIQQGMSMMTLAYYAPIYNGFGRNVNQDRNTTTTSMECQSCGKEWVEKTGNES